MREPGRYPPPTPSRSRSRSRLFAALATVGPALTLLLWSSATPSLVAAQDNLCTADTCNGRGVCVGGFAAGAYRAACICDDEDKYHGTFCQYTFPYGINKQLYVQIAFGVAGALVLALIIVSAVLCSKTCDCCKRKSSSNSTSPSTSNDKHSDANDNQTNATPGVATTADTTRPPGDHVSNTRNSSNSNSNSAVSTTIGPGSGAGAGSPESSTTHSTNSGAAVRADSGVRVGVPTVAAAMMGASVRAPDHPTVAVVQPDGTVAHYPFCVCTCSGVPGTQRACGLCACRSVSPPSLAPARVRVSIPLPPHPSVPSSHTHWHVAGRLAGATGCGGDACQGSLSRLPADTALLIRHDEPCAVQPLQYSVVEMNALRASLATRFDVALATRQQALLRVYDDAETRFHGRCGDKARPPQLAVVSMHMPLPLPAQAQS